MRSTPTLIAQANATMVNKNLAITFYEQSYTFSKRWLVPISYSLVVLYDLGLQLLIATACFILS
jgi:hypothetical protein